MIEREVIEFVAAADWTDDCRIRIELSKRVTKLTIAEAKVLRSELDVAIAEASIGADDLRHEHEPSAFDLLVVENDVCARSDENAKISDLDEGSSGLAGGDLPDQGLRQVSLSVVSELERAVEVADSSTSHAQTISPDCRDGNKHLACIGRAWDLQADEEVPCECTCHNERTAA